MKTNEKIPNLFWVKERPYVRVTVQGRRLTAPCSNDWLREKGLKPTKAMVVRKERILGALRHQAELDSNAGLPPGKSPTVKEAIKAFIRTRRNQPRSLRPSDQQLGRLTSTLLTGTARRPSLIHHLGFNKRLRAVKAADMARLERKMEDARFRPQSIRSWMSDCRTFFSWCVDTGLLGKSPFGRGKYRIPPGGSPQRGDSQYIPWDLQRIESLLPPSTKIHRLWMLSRFTGARRGELLRIRFRDIDLRNCRVVIHGAAKNPQKEVRPRLVGLLPQLSEFVQSLNGRPDWFICSLDLEPWSSDACRTNCRRFFRKHGITLSTQRMRRTFAQLLAESGESLEQIAQALGNSPETLKNWYLEPHARPWDPGTMEVLQRGSIDLGPVHPAPSPTRLGSSS